MGPWRQLAGTEGPLSLSVGTFDLAPQLSPRPTGVLENPSSKDRPAVQKAKTLYRSCMDESERGGGGGGHGPGEHGREWEGT